MEVLLHGRGDQADAQVRPQQDDGDVGVRQEVGQIVVGEAEGLVALPDLLAGGDELLVGGLGVWWGGGYKIFALAVYLSIRTFAVPLPKSPISLAAAGETSIILPRR